MKAESTHRGPDATALELPPGRRADCLATAFTEPEEGGEGEAAAAGFRIGPYRVLRELGRGGMGAVYLAVRDAPAFEHPFEQQVAVKLIKRGMDTDEIVRRFVQERKILAGLIHPNIARLLDGGTTEDGRPYFVMEPVAGERITVFAAARKLGVEERLRLMLKVASAVQLAHQNLIVHRDLKPGNILVGEYGEPKLLDFGIAKLLDASAFGTPAELTGLKERPMTPDYASPEQRAGGAVTTASDVYSLGVLLHELLVGELPGAGGERRLPSQELSARGDARGARRLAGDLDTIVGKALEPEPERRYGTAAALAEDLERHLDQRPVLARRPTLAYRLGRTLRRHKLASASVLAVTLLSGFATYQAVEAARQAAEAERQRGQAEAVVDFLQELFKAAGPDQSRGRQVTARELLDLGALRLLSPEAGRPAVEPGTRVPLLLAIGEVYTNLGLYPQARKALEQILASEPGALDRARALSALGEVAIEQGDFAGSRRRYEAALQLKRRLRGPRDLSLAEDLNGLGRAATELGDAVSARRHLESAVEICRAAGARGREILAAALNNLGHLAVAEGRLDEAEKEFLEALAIDRELLGAEATETLRVRGNLAILYYNRGDAPRASELYRELLEIQRRLLGPAHPDLAFALTNLATAELALEHYTAAAALLREALAMRRQLSLPPDLNEAELWNTLAASQQGSGDLAGAAESFLRSYRGFSEAQGDHRIHRGNVLRGLALVRQEQGDLAAAEKGVRDSLALLDGVPNAEQQVAISLYALARIEQAGGRRAEAAAHYREILRRYAGLLGEDNDWIQGANRRLRELEMPPDPR